MSKDNVIAVISLIRMDASSKKEGDTVTSFLEMTGVQGVIKDLLSEHDTRPKAKETKELKDYGPKDMFELSLNCFRSKDNLNYANQYYLQYIQGLVDDTNRIMAEEDMINDAFKI